MLKQVDSTNNYAMNLVQEGLAYNGQGIIAFAQTAGKGQRTKHWFTEEGKGLNLSVIVSMEFLPPAHFFQLLAAVAVAVADAITNTAGCTIKLKWPNDLFWNDRKAGGMLIQSVIQGSTWKWAVIGVGINVLQDHFPDHLPNAVSLKQIGGKEINIQLLAENIRSSIMQEIGRLKDEGFEKIYNRYLHKLYKVGETIMARIGDKEQSLYIKGVTGDGLLETGKEKSICYAFGEVEWILP